MQCFLYMHIYFIAINNSDVISVTVYSDPCHLIVINPLCHLIVIVYLLYDLIWTSFLLVCEHADFILVCCTFCISQTHKMFKRFVYMHRLT